jgi:hypothetical protein
MLDKGDEGGYDDCWSGWTQTPSRPRLQWGRPGRTKFGVDFGGRFRAGGYWARGVGCAERGGDPVVEIGMVICEVVAS